MNEFSSKICILQFSFFNEIQRSFSKRKINIIRQEVKSNYIPPLKERDGCFGLFYSCKNIGGSDISDPGRARGQRPTQALIPRKRIKSKEGKAISPLTRCRSMA